MPGVNAKPDAHISRYPTYPLAGGVYNRNATFSSNMYSYQKQAFKPKCVKFKYRGVLNFLDGIDDVNVFAPIDVYARASAEAPDYEVICE